MRATPRRWCSSAPFTPADPFATVYKVLGIDTRLSFKDHSDRPIPILDEGQPIDEVL